MGNTIYNIGTRGTFLGHPCHTFVEAPEADLSFDEDSVVREIAHRFNTPANWIHCVCHVDAYEESPYTVFWRRVLEFFELHIANNEIVAGTLFHHLDYGDSYDDYYFLIDGEKFTLYRKKLLSVGFEEIAAVNLDSLEEQTYFVFGDNCPSEVQYEKHFIGRF